MCLPSACLISTRRILAAYRALIGRHRSGHAGRIQLPCAGDPGRQGLGVYGNTLPNGWCWLPDSFLQGALVVGLCLRFGWLAGGLYGSWLWIEDGVKLSDAEQVG